MKRNHQFYNYLNNNIVIFKERKKKKLGEEENYNNTYHASHDPFYFNFFNPI